MKSAAEMRSDHETWRDAGMMVTICTLCDPFATHTGTAGSGREWAAAHRAELHPEVERRPRKRISGKAQKARAMERSEWKREKFAIGE